MLQRSLRDPVAKLIAPLVKILIKLRISANLISTIGGVGSAASALYFFPKGEFFIGVLWVAGFVIFDLFDGAVARASHKGVSKWGAVLDSTLDRLSDAAIFVLHGLEVEYAMAIGIWVLVLLSVITMAQRMLIVYKAVK